MTTSSASGRSTYIQYGGFPAAVAAARQAQPIPGWFTDDPRFTGGRLAVAPRQDLISWLAHYGTSPDDPDLNQRD